MFIRCLGRERCKRKVDHHQAFAGYRTRHLMSKSSARSLKASSSSPKSPLLSGPSSSHKLPSRPFTSATNWWILSSPGFRASVLPFYATASLAWYVKLTTCCVAHSERWLTRFSSLMVNRRHFYRCLVLPCHVLDYRIAEIIRWTKQTAGRL